MPKSYSDKERIEITEKLRNYALESIIQKGIKKTTVDELVRKVHIPKGTFYLFYESKELLIYEALMIKEDEIHKKLAAKLIELNNNLTVENLTNLLLHFFQLTFSTGMIDIMLNGELEVLMRKLPDELVAESISKDDKFFIIFCQLFPEMSSDKLNKYSAAFRAVFLSYAFKREIGESFDEALKLLIRGLVIQMEDEND